MLTVPSFDRTSMPRGRKKRIDHLRYPDEALGRSQGGFGTKVHVRADGKGEKSPGDLPTSGKRKG